MPVLNRLILIFLLFTSLNVAAENEFKIITLQHHLADEILSMIQPLAGEDGVITGMQNQIIVRVSPARMLEVEQAIASLDMAQQNLKITVSHQNNMHSSREDIDVRARQKIGKVQVRTNRYPNNAPEGVQLHLENQQSDVRSNSNQFIHVLDRQTAFIRVGQSVPFTQEWVTYLHRYITVQTTTEFVDITTGFAVRPQSIGNEIVLEITPRIAKLNQQGFIDFEELTTTVRVKKGEWLDLAGMMAQKDEVSKAILSQKNTSQIQNDALSIRVD